MMWTRCLSAEAYLRGAQVKAAAAAGRSQKAARNAAQRERSERE
jgi:hypothetical protein